MERKEPNYEENGYEQDGSSRRVLFNGNWDGDCVEVVESTVKKRKRGKKKEEEVEETMVENGQSQSELQDPLVVLGFDIMHNILSLLDARSVALSLLVSRGWHGVAFSDRLWAIKCKELWRGKAHIPRTSKLRGLSNLAAYSLSAMDSKRARIMRDDLCDHVWKFRFMETAPVYWRNQDPYWKGTGQIMQRYFHQDGSQTADPSDEVWGGHEACYSVVTGLDAEGKIREHYVRINRWPPMSISRKEDWSWEMGNRICCYYSIPDPDKVDGTGPLFSVV